MNQPHLPPPLSSTPTNNPNPSSMKISSECGNCGSQNRWLLHHVRLRGINRRLCTSCVLRLHPSSFCPSCFQFYDTSSSPHPHPSNRFTCVKCSSISHSHCVLNPSSVDPQPVSSSSSYLCPPCAKPSFSFFDLDSKPGSSGRVSDKSIDRKMAVVLLCAAKIASASMGKAVIVARADAERKVREAALARKRAREALEHVGFLVAREKARRKDVPAEVSGSGNVASKEKERNRNVGGMVKVESSCEGSAVANTTDNGSALTQKRESLNGFVRQISLVKNEVPAATEEVARQKNVDADCLQSNKTVNEKEKSGKFGDNENENEGGKVEHVQNEHIGGNGDTK